MKKTAVEWLAEKYNLVGTADYEQAKEIEKQQIIDACNYGKKYNQHIPYNSEKYYNETFKINT